MRLFLFLLRHAWKGILFAGLGGMVAGSCGVLLIGLINERLGRLDELTRAFALTFAGVVTVMLVTNLLSRVVLNHLVNRVTYELGIEMCWSILNAPLRMLERIGRPKLLSMLSSDVPIISRSLVLVSTLFINATIMLGCLIYLAWLSWPLLVLLLVVGTVVGLIYRIPYRRAIAATGAARANWDQLFDSFTGVTSGVKELKVNRGRRLDFMERDLAETSDSYRRNVTRATDLHAVAFSWSQVALFLCLGVMLFSLPRLGGVRMEQITGFILVVLYMKPAIGSLVSVINGLAVATVSLDRIEGAGLPVMAGRREPAARADTVESHPVGRIELDQVTHRYHREGQSDAFTLGPVSLTLEPGELVFVIGGNGSGKSTLVKLLVGLYEPESGEIRLDGQVVTPESLDAYRQSFSVLFSDYYLFRRLAGDATTDQQQRAEEYLDQLQLVGCVDVRDGELSTRELSGGQRKRLALLNAYLEDRPVYVFDEWAADQDPQFKGVFYRKLLPELRARGKTVVVVSHDDHYYHAADRLLKMDYGRIEAVLEHTDQDASLLS